MIGRPFPPGQSGNPKGRPKGSRHRLSELALRALCADFEAHGAAAIERCRSEPPPLRAVEGRRVACHRAEDALAIGYRPLQAASAE